MVAVKDESRGPEPAPASLRAQFGLPPRVWHAMLVSAAYVVGLGAAYSILPLDGHLRGRGYGLLSVALVVIVACMALQLRAILRSRSPGVRGVQALITLLTVLLLSFAAIYVILSHSSPGSFNETLNHVDGLYFTVTVFATVGFGDIVAVSNTARIIVTTQMLLNLAVLGVGVRVIVGAVKLGREREQRPANPTPPPPPL
jgi:voltage-gated potassium channel